MRPACPLQSRQNGSDVRQAAAPRRRKICRLAVRLVFRRHGYPAFPRRFLERLLASGRTNHQKDPVLCSADVARLASAGRKACPRYECPTRILCVHRRSSCIRLGQSTMASRYSIAPDRCRALQFGPTRAPPRERRATRAWQGPFLHSAKQCSLRVELPTDVPRVL